MIQNKSNEKAIELAFAFLKALIIYTAIPEDSVWASLVFVTDNGHTQHIPLSRALYLYFIIFGP